MEKRSIYKITQDVLALESLILENEGELNSTLLDWMKINEENLSEKVDAYKYFIDHLEKGVEYFKEKETEFKIAKKQYENQIDSLKANLRVTMLNLGIDELKGNDYRFKLSLSKPKVMISDEGLIPATFLREIVKYEPDKDKIREAIESGDHVSGAILDQSVSIRSYINKKDKQ